MGSRNGVWVGEECQHTWDLIGLYRCGTASPGLALRHPLPPGNFAPHISHQQPQTQCWSVQEHCVSNCSHVLSDIFIFQEANFHPTIPTPAPGNPRPSLSPSNSTPQAVISHQRGSWERGDCSQGPGWELTGESPTGISDKREKTRFMWKE